MKLPNKWKYWCKKSGLRPYSGNARNTNSYWYLKGKGYVWRVNCHGNFQRGDTYEDFDRWALCTISETPCPQNEKQFKMDVEWLLTDSEEPK